MEFEEYKIYQQKHIALNNGTSKEECALILSIIPFNVLVSLLITSLISLKVLPVIEFFIIVLPVILNLTILADFSHIIFINLIIINCLIIFIKTNLGNLKSVLYFPVERDKSIISNFRACTNFVTAICILAVDFKIFPRRFAKTETFGFGLMDLGVGFFICSNGLVEKHKKQSYQFTKAIKKNSILLGLGISRLFLVKILNYHEHLTEYGVHWNFFFSLFCCKTVIFLIKYFTKDMNLLWLTFLTCIIHELLLNLGLKNWVLSDAPRDSFWSANREGLVSCLGFVGLYFAANFIGQVITYCSLNYKTLLMNLTFMCAVTWLGTSIFYEISGISRRIVNVGYIFWVLSMSLIVILLLLIGKVITIAVKKSNTNGTPLLFQEINANGLFFFLLSNFLTGLINFLFQTFLLSNALAIIIIISYMATVCSITHYLFVKNIFF